MNTYIEISSIIPGADSATNTLILDIEVESSDKFPSPKKANRQVICATAHTSYSDGIICYGVRELSGPVRKAFSYTKGRYVKCDDEKDLLQKLLTMVFSSKVTHCFGTETIPNLRYLTSRAAKLGVKIQTPDFDSMFRKYDNSYYATMGVAEKPKKNCPIAARAYELYEKMMVTGKKPYRSCITVGTV